MSIVEREGKRGMERGGDGIKEEGLLDAAYLSKIREKVEELKSLLKHIEEEIKRKGKYSPALNAWEVKSGIFFDAVRYGYELNSKIRSKALEVLEALREAFPFIPYESIELRITSPYDPNDSVIKMEEIPERKILFPPTPFGPGVNPFMRLSIFVKN
jgi:hypothetical protein